MSHCILCQSSPLLSVLDLGFTPLANKFLTKAELANDEASYPLHLGICESCLHMQLLDAVAPPLMFDDYLYVSSMSETLRQHLKKLADEAAARVALSAADLVVDIGSNDGTLLSWFARFGVRTLGIDPAQNLAALAAKNGIQTLTAYFGEQTAERVVAEYGRAKVITATNVFPHIPNLPDFVKGLQRLLAPDGTCFIQAHYLVDLMEQGAFDTIYHEHVSYWALGPARRLFAEFGMSVVDAERLPEHHGQLRLVIQQGTHAPSERMNALLAAEAHLQIPSVEGAKKFAQSVYRIKDEVSRTISELRGSGKRIVGYGAPAKGNTLLCFLGIGPDQIEYIADKSPLKQGRYSPGMHIPVVSPARLLEDQPDYVLLLAWNFADEVLEQQAEYRKRGGKFIIPLPHVKIV